MKDKIIDLKEYLNGISNLKQIENEKITLDSLDLDELSDLKKIYNDEVMTLIKKYRELISENKKLKSLNADNA